MSELKDLIAKGKVQGFLSKREILDILPSEIEDPGQIEDIMQMIRDMKIQISEPNQINDKR